MRKGGSAIAVRGSANRIVNSYSVRTYGLRAAWHRVNVDTKAYVYHSQLCISSVLKSVLQVEWPHADY